MSVAAVRSKVVILLLHVAPTMSAHLVIDPCFVIQIFVEFPVLQSFLFLRKRVLAAAFLILSM